MIIKFNKKTAENLGGILSGIIIVAAIIGFQVMMYYGFKDLAREVFGNHSDYKLMAVIAIGFVMTLLSIVGAFLLPSSQKSNESGYSD